MAGRSLIAAALLSRLIALDMDGDLSASSRKRCARILHAAGKLVAAAADVG